MGRHAFVAGSSPAEAPVRDLFGRDALYLLMSSLQVFTVFLITPVVTRLLAPAQFGVIATGTAVMQVLFVVAGLGLGQALQREYASHGGAEITRMLITASTILAGVVTGLALIALPSWVHLIGGDVTYRSMLWSILWAGTSAVTSTCLAVLRSRDSLGFFSVVSATQTIAADVLGLILIEWLHHSADVWLFGQFAAQVLAAVIGVAALRPKLVRRVDLARIAAALRFGLPLMGSAISVFIMNSSDRLVIGALKNSYSVGRYQIAYSVGSIPTLVIGLLSMAWMPRFYAAPARSRETLRLIEQSRDAVAHLLPAVVLGVGVGAPVLLHLWAPPSYKPAQLAAVTLVVLIAVVPTAFTAAWARLLIADGRTVVIATTTLLAAVANVGLNLLLVPTFGIEGSAAATLAASIALALMTSANARRIAVLARSRVLPLLLTAAALAVAAAASSLSFTVGTTALRVLVCVGSAVWLAYSIQHVRTSGAG